MEATKVVPDGAKEQFISTFFNEIRSDGIKIKEGMSHTSFYL